MTPSKKPEEQSEKKVDLDEPIVRAYKAALDNPTIFTVAALQDSWLRGMGAEIEVLKAKAVTPVDEAQR
jgi:hypothetical protein